MLEGDMPIDTPETPLIARMMESMPGISTGIAFGSFRGSSTLLRGGYMDEMGGKTSRFSKRRAARHRIMQGGNLSGSASTQFLGSGSRSTTGKTPMFRSGRLNNATLRPRAFGRFHSMSVFSDPSNNAYSPFQGASMLGKGKTGQKALSSMGISLREGETAFGPGMLSGISAGRRVDLLERRAMKGSSRAAAKLSRADDALGMLVKMNNPTLTKPTIMRGSTGMGAGYTAPYSNISYGASFSDDAMRYAVTGKNAGQVGIRGNMYASSMSGAGTQFVGGYFRGAQGFGGTGGLAGRALEGALSAEKSFGSAFKKAFGDEGLTIGGKLIKGSDQAIDFLKSTGNGKLFSQLGTSATKKLAVSGAGKMLAARGVAMAIPGVQIIAAASMVYDIGQMAGEAIKSGINLAKDANKSLQGSIAKPAFGMGYKDTEAAATSRARGVQAIQNSRLNARSALGTEGAMMAAHYG